MSKVRFTFNILAVVVFTLTVASMAQAQATRTWVSGVGDDVNPCSRTAPCKTWAGAISKTATGGEIDALDPGGYGTLTITKSITIEGTTGAGFGHTLGGGPVNGFIVNAGASSVVVLRNLYINGVRNCITASCAGLNGVRYIAGAKLIVDRCTIFGFSTNGITADVPGGGKLIVTDSSIEDNNIGIRVTSSAGTLTASIHNSRIIGGTSGIDGLTGAQISVSDSLVTNNTSFGLIAEGGTLNVSDTRINHNGTGVQAQAGTTVNIARCIITNNTNALGQVVNIGTGGNNTIMGNGTNQAPAGFLFSQN